MSLKPSEMAGHAEQISPEAFIAELVSGKEYNFRLQLGYCSCSQEALLNCLIFLFPTEKITNRLIKIIEQDTISSDCGTRPVEFISTAKNLNYYFSEHGLPLEAQYLTEAPDFSDENLLCGISKIDEADPHFVTFYRDFSEVETFRNFDSYPYKKGEKQPQFPRDIIEENPETFVFGLVSREETARELIRRLLSSR